MVEAKKSHGEERHLRDYWRVVWNGRWTALSIFLLVVVLGTVATLLQDPVYEGTVSLEINSRPRGVVPGAEVVQMGAAEYGYLAEERYFNTQYQIIRSRAVVSRVMEKLDLFDHPLYADLEDPTQVFSDGIIVEPVEQTSIVRVKIRAGDAEEAALWANTVAEAYVQRNLDEEAVVKTIYVPDRMVNFVTSRKR